MNDHEFLENGVIDELRRVHESDIRAFIIAKYDIDYASADRIVADTFRSLAEHPERFDRRFRLRPYLFSLASNAAIATKRTADDETVAPPETLEPILERLSALRPDDRQAVALACLGGLSYGAAATACGIPVGSLKTRLHRGLRTLAN